LGILGPAPIARLGYRQGFLSPLSGLLAHLRTRALTDLYNNRPSWPVEPHRKLDETAFAAQGWPSPLTDEEVVKPLLVLSGEHAALQW